MSVKRLLLQSDRVRMSVLTGIVGMLTMLGAFSGCSQIADPNPQAPKAEQNVKNYYILLEAPNMVYHYNFASRDPYLPASDMLTMDMKGSDQNTTYQSMPVWTCLWSYATAGQPRPWFYALSDTEAVGLGIEMYGQYTDSWVELKAPLSSGATWTFTSQGESVTATVAKYGVSATVNGKSYDDVVVVDYKGAAGTTGTTWFARGIGTIYSHIERPGNEMMDLKFQSKTN
ncbi:MAG: hypothetical protein Q8922_08690 [Bacteroidota bacterium]|nr:hypothetical protein [Bacteroidota bacterium]MDP4234382.1 hypothetical protein [Bacteroidota bacterium]MDP4243315.1 hypothetical protein [Bacteroidota bacterium]MDP4288000.1 hypothetical protein [Bacteroidota bacterium]